MSLILIVSIAAVVVTWTISTMKKSLANENAFLNRKRHELNITLRHFNQRCARQIEALEALRNQLLEKDPQTTVELFALQKMLYETHLEVEQLESSLANVDQVAMKPASLRKMLRSVSSELEQMRAPSAMIDQKIEELGLELGLA